LINEHESAYLDFDSPNILLSDDVNLNLDVNSYVSFYNSDSYLVSFFFNLTHGPFLHFSNANVLSILISIGNALFSIFSNSVNLLVNSLNCVKVYKNLFLSQFYIFNHYLALNKVSNYAGSCYYF